MNGVELNDATLEKVAEAMWNSSEQANEVNWETAKKEPALAVEFKESARAGIEEYLRLISTPSDTCFATEPPDLEFSKEVDWEGLLNVRNFLKSVLIKHPNIKFIGAGVGVDGADLDLLIEGHKFNIKIVAR